MNDGDLSHLLVDIFDGVSVLESSIGPIFIRHFHQLEVRRIFSNRENLIFRAKAMGLETEENILKSVIADGAWSKDEEKSVQEKTKFVENLRKGLNKIKLPSQKKLHRNLIKREEDKLKNLSKSRDDIIGLTVEKYVDAKINRDFFDSLMFLDKEFSRPVFDEIEVGEIRKEFEMRDLQSEFFRRMSDDFISKVALSSDFSPYLPYSEDVIGLFGKPLKDLTAFQLKLITFSRYFLNIFKNCPKEIPESVARDPDLLIDFNESCKENNSNKRRVGSEGSGGTTYFGATESDLNQMKGDDESTINLSDKIKEKGGSLNMKDFMAMHKQN